MHQISCKRFKLRNPLLANWSETCSMMVSWTKGWKAFFTVPFSSTKGAVAVDIELRRLVREPHRPYPQLNSSAVEFI